MKPLVRRIAHAVCATDCALKGKACAKCTHAGDFAGEAEKIIRLAETALRNHPDRAVTLDRLDEFARAVAPLYFRVHKLEWALKNVLDLCEGQGLVFNFAEAALASGIVTRRAETPQEAPGAERVEPARTPSPSSSSTVIEDQQ